TVQPSPQTVTFGTEVRSAVWTTPFPVPANTAVVMSVTSPNAADSDVDVTAYLYDAMPAAQAGDLMGLANDAITAAKFDESTAYPVASADTGVTQIARVGADGDTLETLSDQMDAITTDINELQTDWTDGGRLDLILDALIPGAAVNIDHDSTVIIQEDG
ncbi:MAG TPA: hypothetical protein VM238_21195, partial [Phycisphaerae bacterium]|nr:hypothetical protein [Phycisphaerae bacterium]